MLVNIFNVSYIRSFFSAFPRRVNNVKASIQSLFALCFTVCIPHCPYNSTVIAVRGRVLCSITAWNWNKNESRITVADILVEKVIVPAPSMRGANLYPLVLFRKTWVKADMNRIPASTLEARALISFCLGFALASEMSPSVCYCCCIAVRTLAISKAVSWIS